jgi:hypothetical protein
MDRGSFERLVARWRAVRSVVRVDRVWDGGSVDDVSVEVGRSERKVGRGCLGSALAPARTNGTDDEQRIPARPGRRFASIVRCLSYPPAD